MIFQLKHREIDSDDVQKLTISAPAASPGVICEIVLKDGTVVNPVLEEIQPLFDYLSERAKAARSSGIPA